MTQSHFKSKTISEKDIVFTSFIQAVAALTKSSAVAFEMCINGQNSLLHGVDASKTIGFLSEYVPMVISVSGSDDRLTQLLFCKKQLDNILKVGLTFNAMKHMHEDSDIREVFEQFPSVEFNVNFTPTSLFSHDSDPNITDTNESPLPISSSRKSRKKR